MNVQAQIKSRNLMCSSLAVALIASGRVRRARKRTLNGNIVTAIYFHNPNKRLFAQCILWLKKNGYQFISDDELIRILHRELQPPNGAVWLSFDDGFKELLENVLPLARDRRVPITLFIPSGIVGGAGLFPWLHQTIDVGAIGVNEPKRNEARDAITVAELREIAKYAEVSIGSHTAGHVVTPNLSDERAKYEFGESKRALESWTGQTIKSFAYPEGRVDGRESRFLAEYGYQLAATTEVNFVTQATDPYYVPRLHVGDNIWFPEAICNMVGVWRPVIDPLISILRRWRRIAGRLSHTPVDPTYTGRKTSV